VAFLPPEVAAGLPAVIRPLIANGFVVGIVTVLGLEHIVYRRRPQDRS
jgi:uracil permease